MTSTLQAGHMVLAAGAAHATGAAAQANTVSAGSLLVHLVVGLGIVLALIAVATRILRGRSGLGGGTTQRRQAINVLGRHGLGKGISVALVEVGGEAYLLGITPSSVRRLGTLDADAIGGGRAASAASGAASKGSLRGLTQLFQVQAGGEGVAATTTATRGQRSAPTWTSAIEQLREMTVRRS